MNYKTVLRHQPWLRFMNRDNISFRFLKYSHGDLFIAYNTLNDSYELHSVRSYRLTDSSCNGVLDDNQVNGYALYNFREHELKKFMYEIQDDLEKRNRLYDTRSDARTATLKNSLKQIELALGTKV